jgi:hypothetical protein
MLGQTLEESFPARRFGGLGPETPPWSQLKLSLAQ